MTILPPATSLREILHTGDVRTWRAGLPVRRNATCRTCVCSPSLREDAAV